MHYAGRHQQITKPSEVACDKWIEEQLAYIMGEYDLTEEDQEGIRDAYNSCRDGNNILDWEKLQTVGYYDLNSGEVIELSENDVWYLDFTEYTHDFLVACEGLRFAAAKWARRTRGEVE